MTSDLNVVEICAGAGGQSLGLHRAGFQHALAVEIDSAAADTLVHNLSKRHGIAPDVRIGDAADSAIWNPVQFAGIDLFAGGVPCPPFSTAGRQLGSSDERDLFAWAVEAVGVIRPRAVLLENVRGLSMPRFSGYRQAVADRLAEFGYWSQWRLIQSSDHGVAQLRPRFILVAMPEEYARHFVWPEPSESQLTVGADLFDLMAEDGWRYAEKWAVCANRVAPTIVGGSKKHGGADLGPTRAKAAWAELMVDGKGIADAPPARTEVSFRTKMPRLTNRMVARLQGWERPGYEWDFLGRKTSVYRQIGNAFPPPVAEALGRAIRNALERTTPVAELESKHKHDAIYSILRAAGGPVSELELLELTGRGPVDLDRRIAALSMDFELDEIVQGEARAYQLGEFKAFTGQNGHARHEHFKDARKRATVS